MRVLTLVGARPQFIKAAAVSRALSEAGDEEVLVHTGQHYDAAMSDVFFDELEIQPPSYHLDVGSGSHGVQTGTMLARIEAVLTSERPDWVLVYGDTNSTLAGTLAAVKLHIPVAHVEAGLRSFNRRMPEEINRVLTDHASLLLFTPTEAADINLENEGIPSTRVRRVGDVMFDVTKFYGAKAEHESDVLQRLGIADGGYVLATIHRAENTDDAERLRVVFEALGRFGSDHPVVLPLHPRTRKALEREGLLNEVARQIQLVEPVGYLDMLMLERHAALIATDSGGVQKEAYFAGRPCVTLRDETEWTELIELGWNRLAPPVDVDRVLHELESGLRSGAGRDATPYGVGDSAHRIVDELARAPRVW